MFDIMYRAARHPFDYLGVINRHTLTLTAIEDQGDSCWSFIFTPKKPLAWKAGQHGLFTLPRQRVQGKSWRAFSVASSQHEGVVRIATIIPPTPSDFKQKLKTLALGQTVHLYGPFGEFHARPTTTKIVGIAGGIGITPFRALMFEISHGHLTDISLELIYAGKNNHWAFAEECRNFANHPHITITYTDGAEPTNAAIEAAAIKNGNNATYFISGSPGMITAVKANLKKHSIRNIVNDPFKGY